jgi:hypothetical protein
MEERPIRPLARALLGLALGGALLLGAALPAAAHDHFSANGQAGDGQVLANGQNHPRFLPNGDGTFTSCESYGPVPGDSIGPAWYGLETAHHGPDSGDPGRAEGCYKADGSPAAGQDDQNPAIR